MENTDLKTLPLFATKSQIFKMYLVTHPEYKIRKEVNEVLREVRKDKYRPNSKALVTKEICLIVERLDVPKGYDTIFSDGKDWLDKLKEVIRLEKIRSDES